MCLFSLLSCAARMVPLKSYSGQVSAQLKTYHWFTLRIKLQMLPPTMSYVTLCHLPPLHVFPHLLPLPSIHVAAATWTSVFLEPSRHLLPRGLSTCCSPHSGHFSPCIFWAQSLISFQSSLKCHLCEDFSDHHLLSCCLLSTWLSLHVPTP